MDERTRELAEQAGFRYIKDEGIGWAGNHNASLPRFAELVRADEREACAKVCENAISANQVGKTVCINLAEKIRRQALAQPVDLAKVGEVGVWGEKPPTKRDNLSLAAEQALEALESLDCGDTYKTHNAASALRQALNETPPCKTHPDAPHGFDRNASHGADRYVCECEGWEPPKRDSSSWVGLTDEEIYAPWPLATRIEFARWVEAKLKEKNSNDPT